MTTQETFSTRLAPGTRRFGHVNWLGLWTLYWREVRRFLKIHLQTIFAPAMNSLIFLLIFKLALGKYRPDVAGVPFATFMAPGLVMMGVLQNAFANSSSSILMSKVQGNIVDILMPPLSSGELAVAFGFGAATRGLVVGFATILIILPFVDLQVAHFWAIFFYAFGGALMMGQIGTLGAIWADKFDHLATVNNFLIMPLTFLSGTFYSVTILPEPWRSVSFANPFFYMIDGFRFGFTGHAEGNLAIGLSMLVVINLTLWVACLGVLRSGYKLRP